MMKDEKGNSRLPVQCQVQLLPPVFQHAVISMQVKRKRGLTIWHLVMMPFVVFSSFLLAFHLLVGRNKGVLQVKIKVG